MNTDCNPGWRAQRQPSLPTVTLNGIHWPPWIVLALALLLAALYVPWAVGVLRFAPLPAHELAAACALGLLSVFWFEAIKWVQRTRAASGRPLEGQ